VPATHQLIAGIVLVTAVLLLHYRKYRTDTMAGDANRG
ncbi:MAG TPA: branched-chain amino acid transporter AzlC, partial [Marinobacter hydrocarbonoclasticus]|nr:branched-chain amino acid transporter AzlC [Marinobacter nauticus]